MIRIRQVGVQNKHFSHKDLTKMSNTLTKNFMTFFLKENTETLVPLVTFSNIKLH